MISRRARVFLILVIAATYLPFLNQAFHIDDRIYLQIADNIVQKPLFPYDFEAIHEGFAAPDAASHSHLPLTSYYLALVKLLTGSQAEWVYHLAFIVFPLIAAFGFYDLSRRFTSHPLAAACLLVVAPGFLVLSHTLMTDVPLLAFWIVALSTFMRVADGQEGRSVWLLCALSLLAASFISLVTAGLILLMAVYALEVGGQALLFRTKKDGRPPISAKSWQLAALLLLPLLLWFLWYLRAYVHYDRFVLVNMFLHMDKRSAFDWGLIGQKAVSFVLNIGATVMIPLALWYGLAGAIAARLGALAFLFSFIPFYLGPFVGRLAGWSFGEMLLFAVFFSTGLLVLGGQTWRFVFLLQKRKTQSLTPAFWFFGIAFAYLFFFYSGSVRYSMLALPPLIILWITALERRIAQPYLLKNLIWLGFASTAVYSLAIACGDYQFAGVYRNVAQEIRQDYAQPGRTIWFTGEWGYRYYMEQEGAEILTKISVQPQAGDIIVKPYIAMPWVTLYDSSEYSDLVEQRYVQMNYPVRMLDFASQAGFYSTGWGILPVSLGSGERWEWFNVFRVRKQYEGEVPEQERPW